MSRGLALGMTGAVCGVAGWALATRVAELADHAPRARLDELVELAVLALGVAVLAWLAGSAALAAACLAARTAGRTWRRGEACVHRFAPAVVRRALVVAVAAGLGVGGAGVASADDLAPAPSGAVAVTVAGAGALDLGWVVSDAEPAAVPSSAAAAVPDPAATATVPAESRTPPSAPTSTATSEATARTGPERPRDTVTVAPGDTLWAIAARHLGPAATDAQIAAAWPAWYAANAEVVGADPDLILPGQVLAVPHGASR